MTERKVNKKPPCIRCKKEATHKPCIASQDIWVCMPCYWEWDKAQDEARRKILKEFWGIIKNE